MVNTLKKSSVFEWHRRFKEMYTKCNIRLITYEDPGSM